MPHLVRTIRTSDGDGREVVVEEVCDLIEVETNRGREWIGGRISLRTANGEAVMQVDDHSFEVSITGARLIEAVRAGS